MAVAKVGAGAWNDLELDEQEDLVAREVWRDEVHSQWIAEKEEEAARKRPGAYKRYQRYMKKHAN